MFECYCKNSGGDLAASIQAGETKIGELGPAIEAAMGKQAVLGKELKENQEDLKAATAAMDEATAIRNTEKKLFDKELADSQTNIAALKKATAVIESGMSGGSFLQSSAVRTLRNHLKKQESLDSDHQEVLSFLSGEQGGE